jgi:hypothetical protein
MSLRYRKVRQLSLARGAHPRGRAFLSAASGLVRVQERLYVIADDELHLGVFDVGSARPLGLVRVPASAGGCGSASSPTPTIPTSRPSSARCRSRSPAAGAAGGERRADRRSAPADRHRQRFAFGKNTCSPPIL